MVIAEVPPSGVPTHKTLPDVPEDASVIKNPATFFVDPEVLAHVSVGAAESLYPVPSERLENVPIVTALRAV